jgi:hypothetical protein
MRRQTRHLEFDHLEQMTLLSAVPAPGLLSPAQAPSGEQVTAFVNAFRKDLVKLERAGVSDVSVTRVGEGAGSRAQFEIDFTYNGVPTWVTAGGGARRIHLGGNLKALKANAARELNTLVTDLQKIAGLKAQGYAIVSVTPILAVPGGGTEDEVTYTQNGVQGTVDVWIPYRPPIRPGAPEPG